MTSVLAVIPARGGSKGVPRKNLQNICGKPLIAYSIEAAKGVSRLTDIIVSTEDEEIAQVAVDHGADVPFMRPAELAEDLTPTFPVIMHALEQMEAARAAEYDAVLLLQPTCPLRTAAHIDTAIDMLLSENCDSVVSVLEVSNTHPFRMKRLVGNRLINYIDQGFEDMRPRQVLPKVYLRNGAIYLNRRQSLIGTQALVGDHCLGMVMDEEESVNIDGRLDLILAESMMQDRQV
tara:strand:+ start:150 stop:851 length:702 start_codon:yes stop_codon:yes gene_type:complete